MPPTPDSMRYMPAPYVPGLIDLGEDVNMYRLPGGVPLSIEWTPTTGYSVTGPADALSIARIHKLLPDPTDERAEGLGLMVQMFTDPKTGELSEELQQTRLEGVVDDGRFTLTDVQVNGQYIGPQRTYSIAQLLEVLPVHMLYTGPFTSEVLVAAQRTDHVVIAPVFDRVGSSGERAVYVARSHTTSE